MSGKGDGDSGGGGGVAMGMADVIYASRGLHWWVVVPVRVVPLVRVGRLLNLGRGCAGCGYQSHGHNGWGSASGMWPGFVWRLDGASGVPIRAGRLTAAHWGTAGRAAMLLNRHRV